MLVAAPLIVGYSESQSSGQAGHSCTTCTSKTSRTHQNTYFRPSLAGAVACERPNGRRDWYYSTAAKDSLSRSVDLLANTDGK